MFISEIDARGHRESHSNPDSAFNRSLREIDANQATWTEVEGVKVLRVGDSNIVAVPDSGRTNASRFTVIDLNDRSEAVCFLRKSEVYGWLCRKSIMDSES